MKYTVSNRYPYTVQLTEGGGYPHRESAQEEADRRNTRVKTWHSTCKPGCCTFKDANCPKKEAQS